MLASECCLLQALWLPSAEIIETREGHSGKKSFQINEYGEHGAELLTDLPRNSFPGMAGSQSCGKDIFEHGLPGQNAAFQLFFLFQRPANTAIIVLVL